MKTRTFFIALIGLAICLLLWKLRPRVAEEMPHVQVTNAVADKATTSVAQVNSSVVEPIEVSSNNLYANEQNIKALVGTNASNPAAEAEATSFLKSIESAVARRNNELIRPISFYGKTVDEQGEPLANVTVSLAWSDLSPSGTSKSQTTSDANGLFSITGITGHMLFVDLSKTGHYLHRKGAQFNFEFARDYDQFHYEPDPNNPVVFRFRKKGTGTELVTSAYGVKKKFGVSAALDGTPVHANLLERKLEPTGGLEISQFKPDYNAPNPTKEWSFRMSIADGGFIEHNDEFPFEAPENGYQPDVEFHFKPGQSNWTSDLKKQYYIAFGRPRRYGQLTLETAIQMKGARLEYAINPDGSRNLEPK